MDMQEWPLCWTAAALTGAAHWLWQLALAGHSLHQQHCGDRWGLVVEFLDACACLVQIVGFVHWGGARYPFSSWGTTCPSLLSCTSPAMVLGAHLICPIHPLWEVSLFCFAPMEVWESLAGVLECLCVLHCQSLGQRVIKYTGTRKLFLNEFF